MMRKFMQLSLIGSGLVILLGCWQQVNEPINWPDPPPVAHRGDQLVDSGTLAVLSYNVAGLPQWLSPNTPADHAPLMGALFNNYDLVLLQEDFFYHSQRVQAADHPYRSLPWVRYWIPIGDGLNRLSSSTFTDVQRHTWQQCHGWVRYRTDCLAAKGFSLARHTIAAGVSVDVYNLHADAGADTGDSAARRAQFAQLAWFIANHSAGQALIVAGDTNLNTERPEDMQILDAFLHATGLQVAAHVLDQPERIDRVMFRSSDAVLLQPMQRWIADEFVDQQGMELSDHPAVAVDFRWQLLGIEEN